MGGALDQEFQAYWGDSEGLGEGDGSPERAAAPSRGYILDRALVWPEQAALVHEGWLRRVEYDPDLGPAPTTRFLCHVLVSGAAAVEPTGGYVPVSARLIEGTLGVHHTERVWRPLLDAGLLAVRRERYLDGLSREFRVRPTLLDEFVRAAPRLGMGRPRYELFSNSPSRSKGRRQYATDSRGEPLPPLIAAALAEIRRTGCPFDLDRAVASVEGLEEAYEAARAAWEVAGQPETGPIQRAMMAAWARWHHDRYCIDQVLLGDVEHVEGPVWRYVPCFKRDPQSAGRITELGGFQSASRGLKHAALAGLRATHDLRNYDLASSQPWGLVQLFEEADVDPTWLRAYLAGDKADFAERAFGDREAATVDLWKACLLALFMSAKLPETTTDPQRRRVGGQWVTPKLPDIAGYIRDAYGGGRPAPEAEAKLAGFAAEVAPFLASRDAWHAHLERVVVERDGRWGRGGRYVRNAAGVTLKVDDLSGWELRSKLAAHLLQGLEAGFIHRLTALAPEFGFGVASNQHDGLITIGEVPEAAVERARVESGLRYARLVEKRYHPDHPIPGAP